MERYRLKVIEVEKTIEDAVVVGFDVPKNLYDVFNYKPGQYLTVIFNLNNQEVRRSYSLCSTPFLEEPLRVGVKRVKKGLVSNHINDNIKVGDEVEVLPPDGRFCADVNQENYKTYYLFAAGSGITPILSILKSVLITEEKSMVNMIFGNRNKKSIMFLEELKKLQNQYPDRFNLTHTLSRANSSWSDLWKRKSDLAFRKGRVDADAVKWLIDTYPPIAQNAEYYICGPGKMIENTKQALQNIDVPDNRIFIESFGGEASESNVAGVGNAHLKAKLDDEEINVTIAEGKTVLRALLDSGHDAPYSCEGGVCSTCMCKLKSGQVHMKNNLSLTDKEVANGYILACQSIPLTDAVEVEFE